jgi:hypothetical protein
MFTRRAFLIGMGTALTLPVVDRFRWFIETYDRPLIEPPPSPVETLYVYPEYDYEIFLGPIADELPEITWRQFITEVRGEPEPTTLSAFRDLYESWGLRPRDLDTPCDPDVYVDCWARTSSPNASAHDLLQRLDLGPELRGGPGEVGGITFIDGCCPGNDYLGVRADDALSVSLLQQRLNELGERIAIELAVY